MKVLHISASYKPAYIYGGPIYSVAALCEHLAKAGHDVEVFTTTANGKEELKEGSIKEAGVKVTYFKRITKDHTHLSPELLIHLWKKVKYYDAVHIHSWWNLVSVLATLVCIMRGVRPVLSPRGMLSDYSHRNSNSISKLIIHSLFGRFLLNRVAFHATSEQEETEINRLIPGAKGVKTIHNLVNIPKEANESLSGETERNTDKLNLLFLSRVHKKKGIELLLEAISELHIPYSLMIVGDGEEQYIDSLKDRAVRLGISDRIHWHPAVVGEKKYELFRNHDLFVLPSYNENFANVVVESLLVGTPVLISDRVGLAQFIKQNGLGWVCERDEKSLGKMLNEIYHSRQALGEFRQIAPGIIKREFSAEKLIKHYLDLYQTVQTRV